MTGTNEDVLHAAAEVVHEAAAAQAALAPPAADAAALILKTAEQTAATLALTNTVIKALTENNTAELYRALGRIEGKLDGLGNDVKEHLKMDTKIHEDQGTRIGSLEKGRSWAIGAAAAISLIVTGAAWAIGFH